MKAYKVVFRKKYQFVSAWVSRCLYELDNITLPGKGNGPLCAFDTLENAKIWKASMFSDAMQNFPILECEIVKSNKDAIWYNNGYEVVSTPLEKLPEGTILCESITPLEVVNESL